MGVWLVVKFPWIFWTVLCLHSLVITMFPRAAIVVDFVVVCDIFRFVVVVVVVLVFFVSFVTPILLDDFWAVFLSFASAAVAY